MVGAIRGGGAQGAAAALGGFVTSTWFCLGLTTWPRGSDPFMVRVPPEQVFDAEEADEQSSY